MVTKPPASNSKSWKRRFVFGLITLSLVAPGAADDGLSELLVLKPDDSGKTLRTLLLREANRAHDRRLERIEAFRTPDDVRSYQDQLRTVFRRSLGTFPDKTPLNARVVGEVVGDGCRIEKLIYESRPGFLVTANLYLPLTPPPFPGVLLPCGHSEVGKAEEAYQRACGLMARNGLAVLCYDPVGQGERKQILVADPDGNLTSASRFRATSEHMLAGIGPILLGENLATYRIWDGIRGLDYLESRPDIDAARLGCTGNSGGGLMTSYLMALDSRIRVAAPSCFITTTRRKNVSPGPGDAEQNLFGQIAEGLDHPDFLLMRAPLPTLICAATHDFVPIEGTWEAFRQAKRVYRLLGASERVDLVEADAEHGFSQPLRRAVTQFMRR